MFTSSIKLGIGKFHVFVEHVDVKEPRNVLKSVMHMKSCCLVHQTNCFEVVVVVVVLKTGKRRFLSGIFSFFLAYE